MTTLRSRESESESGVGVIGILGVGVGILGKLGVGVGVGPYTFRLRNPVTYMHTGEYTMRGVEKTQS